MTAAHLAVTIAHSSDRSDQHVADYVAADLEKGWPDAVTIRTGVERHRQLLAMRVAPFPGYSAGKWRLVDAEGKQVWDSTPVYDEVLRGAPYGPLCAETKRACIELRERLLAESFEHLFPATP